MKLTALLLIFLFTGSHITSLAQSAYALLASGAQIPQNYYSKVNKKLKSITDQLSKKSEKYLAKFEKRERKIRKKLRLSSPDIVITKEDQRYSQLLKKVMLPSPNNINRFKGMFSNKAPPFVNSEIKLAPIGEYNPYLDSLYIALSFLNKYSGITEKVRGPLANLHNLQTGLQQWEKINESIAKRQNWLNAIFSEYPNYPKRLNRQYEKLRNTSYYNLAHIKEYQRRLISPGKLENKVLRILNPLQDFQEFMKENDHLSSFVGTLDSFPSQNTSNAEVGKLVRFWERGICKQSYFTYASPPTVETFSNERNIPEALLSVKKQSKLLQVSGNISYNVNYRSRVDTPYAEKNLYQHTLQTRLDFVYKERYPFKVYLTTRFSNSSLFRKYTDLNFQYKQADFVSLLKQRIIKGIESYISSQTKSMDSLRRRIDLEKASIASLNHLLLRPDISQKLVEEREQKPLGNENGSDKSNNDAISDNLATQQTIFLPGESKSPSIFQKRSKIIKAPDGAGADRQKIYSYKDSLDNKKQILDSLVADLDKTQKFYNILLSVQQLNQDKWRNEIINATDANSLTKNLHRLGIPDTVLPKGYKTLYSLQSFNIGRSMVNYSELSVKDISIAGIQAEYNPHYYYAFAIGKVDYRFRDYIIPNSSRSNQYLALVRFGKGTRKGNHIFFTYYTGKRQFFNSSVAFQPNNLIPTYNLAGITMEGFYKLNRNVSLIIEVAKSTKPYYSLDSLQTKNWMNSVTRFKDHSNEAISITLNSNFPKTKTRFAGNIKYTGTNFQSFSTFTTGASQTKWSARIEQPFFKKKLTVFSSLQQNDYSNPYVTSTYKSSSLLASLQANLRIKNWPFISLGYYPSYQLTKINTNNYTESRYYTLVANSGYYYHIHGVQLSSCVVLSEFYNGAGDSGFVYFNSKNLLISQTAALNNVSFQVNGTMSVNTGYKIYTLENNDQLTINKSLSAGGGLRVIKQSVLKDLMWGYSGNVRLSIRKLGEIQLMFDKGFLPGGERRLVTNDMGRLTYFKTF